MEEKMPHTNTWEEIPPNPWVNTWTNPWVVTWTNPWVVEADTGNPVITATEIVRRQTEVAREEFDVYFRGAWKAFITNRPKNYGLEDDA
jgi:hypothetical protein